MGLLDGVRFVPSDMAPYLARVTETTQDGFGDLSRGYRPVERAAAIYGQHRTPDCPFNSIWALNSIGSSRKMRVHVCFLSTLPLMNCDIGDVVYVLYLLVKSGFFVNRDMRFNLLRGLAIAQPIDKFIKLAVGPPRCQIVPGTTNMTSQSLVQGNRGNTNVHRRPHV